MACKTCSYRFECEHADDYYTPSKGKKERLETVRKKKIGYRISEEAHKALKYLAVNERCTEEALLNRIILEYCERKGVVYPCGI